MQTLRSPFCVLLMAGLSVALAAPAAAEGVAVHVEDDAMLPIIIGVKARADLELALAKGDMLVLDDRTIDWRLKGEPMPVCLEDDECWREVAARMVLQRLLVMDVFAVDDHEVARVRVIEPSMAGLPAPVYEEALPSGGGFPIEVAHELAMLPLYVQPLPEPEVKEGFLARLFGR